MAELSDHRDDGMNPLDQATQRRLSRLSGRPVDTSRLDKQLRAALAGEAPAARLTLMRRVWRPVAGLAVAAVVVVALSVAFLGGGGPALAAPSELVRLHQQAVAEMPAGMTVNNVADANQVLARQWSEAPALPAPPKTGAAAEHLHSCCIREVQNRKLACVLLEDGQTPVTMVVAHSRDFKPASGQTMERGGQTYTANSVDGVQMVMTRHDGRYVCLMGKLPAERLLAIAEQLRF